jgi:hypothetical protein
LWSHIITTSCTTSHALLAQIFQHMLSVWIHYEMCAYYAIAFANGHNTHTHTHRYFCSCLRVVYKVMAESITRPNPFKSHLVNTYSNGVSDFNFLSLEGASGVRWWPNFVKLSFRYWVWIMKRNISDTWVLSVIKWTHARSLFGCKNMLKIEHRIWLIPIQTVYGFVWSTYSPLMYCIWVV